MFLTEREVNRHDNTKNKKFKKKKRKKTMVSENNNRESGIKCEKKQANP